MVLKTELDVDNKSLEILDLDVDNKRLEILVFKRILTSIFHGLNINKFIYIYIYVHAYLYIFFLPFWVL